MPRFAHLFEAAADTLNAYYQAVAEGNIDSLMALWIDEEFVTCICADGSHLHGLDSIRAGFRETARNRAGHDRTARYPRLRQPRHRRLRHCRSASAGRSGRRRPTMVFTTYVMVHERGEWRIAHIHASAMPTKPPASSPQKCDMARDRCTDADLAVPRLDVALQLIRKQTLSHPASWRTRMKRDPSDLPALHPLRGARASAARRAMRHRHRSQPNGFTARRSGCRPACADHRPGAVRAPAGGAVPARTLGHARRRFHRSRLGQCMTAHAHAAIERFRTISQPSMARTPLPPDDAPLFVLFHGLEGSSDSHYARVLMAAAKARGWHGVVPHFRSCSGSLNLLPRFYHLADSNEVDWVLRRLRRHASRADHRGGRIAGRQRAAALAVRAANRTQPPSWQPPPRFPRRSTCTPAATRYRRVSAWSTRAASSRRSSARPSEARRSIPACSTATRCSRPAPCTSSTTP